MVGVPAGSAVVVQLAFPRPSRDTTSHPVAPGPLNATVPVGIPNAPETEAVTVTKSGTVKDSGAPV